MINIKKIMCLIMRNTTVLLTGLTRYMMMMIKNTFISNLSLKNNESIDRGFML